MTLPLKKTDHLTDETLAAHIDGLLSPEARADAERHLIGCNDCYAIYTLASDAEEGGGDEDVVDREVVPISRTPVPSSGRHATWSMATLAVAAALMAMLWTPVHRWYQERTAGVPALVRAADRAEHRVIIARISGGFAYKPVRRLRLGADDAAGDDSAPVIQAAARVRERTAGDDSAHALQALGIAQLLAGDANEAVASLEAAVRRSAERDELPAAVDATRDFDLLSDLSAAYLTRGEDGDTLAALGAAEQAWSLRKTPEIAWNRALASAAARSNSAVVNGWRDYLALDSASPWADEARRLMRQASDAGSGIN
jgi:hypothetical protein